MRFRPGLFSIHLWMLRSTQHIYPAVSLYLMVLIVFSTIFRTLSGSGA